MYGQLVFPPYTPFGFFQRWHEEFMSRIATDTAQKSTSGSRPHTPYYVSWLLKEMMVVQEGGFSGEYFGREMTPGHTLDLAAISGDYNKVHISGSNPIAHGMHGVTEALEAFGLYLARHALARSIKGISVEFRRRVPLDGNRLRHFIFPFHIGDDPQIRTIEVFAANEEKKPAIVIKVSLEDGAFDRKAVGYNLYYCLRISSGLADTWPNCIFYQFSANFGEPPKKEDWTNVSVKKVSSYAGRGGETHFVVDVSSGPLSGKADIIPPAE